MGVEVALDLLRAVKGRVPSERLVREPHLGLQADGVRQDEIEDVEGYGGLKGPPWPGHGDDAFVITSGGGGRHVDGEPDRLVPARL